ncbi:MULTISPECIES: MDR family MFS transporter [Micromonospora]|uniref:Drug resistance transporter, EmrB/QacA subfamily n=1 Tax=Micromonospora rifamycinica TaxID=291594 RepID=A0A109IFZ2_9ACTN|nr:MULTISPECIES: MDR family MFS transporter [Micromonospora]KWV29836.1 multidrug MFS transporter [Micromonospora rifamycinica]WFE66713.1 MDR family MFS transporter [Micromonospora sp. WMMD714]SCG81397.1 drug resistance transporter, EmrB/QacA subfamily [Micromonospora rifamycinica]
MTAPAESIDPPGAAPGRMSHREVLQALSGLMVGMFVAILASTVVANALPRIIAELNGSQTVYTWIVTTELLAMTATVPLWGKMADLYSKKLLIQLSLGLFVLGSLIAGLSRTVEVLLVSRVVQGVGAGGMTALALIVMAAMIPPRELGRYAGVFGAVFGVGTIAGPLIGGVLVDTSWLGWRWCFLIGVPFSLISIVLLQRTLHLPVVRRKARIDWWGALLITAGVSTLLVWSSLAGHRFAWASGWTALMVVGGLVLLALAVWVESKVPEPIIPLRIFRSRTVTLTTVASVLVGVALFGGTVFLSQYFQTSLGKSPTVAGLMSLPMILGLLVSSTVAGQLITRYGRWKAYLVAGAAVMTVGMLLLSTIDADTGVPLLSLYMAVLGTGVGMLMQNLVLAAQNDVPAHELGAATSVLTFFRSMGGAIGVSALGAVLANRVTGLLTERLGPAAGATGGGTTEVPDLAALPAPVLAVVRDAYATATAELFLVGAPIAFLALVAVLFVREKPLHETSGDERAAQESAALTAVH